MSSPFTRNLPKITRNISKIALFIRTLPNLPTKMNDMLMFILAIERNPIYLCFLLWQNVVLSLWDIVRGPTENVMII